MLRKERLQRILREINVHNRVLSAELSDLLAVSEDTIRRDLDELATQGSITRVHGGAMSPSFSYPFNTETKVYAQAAKQQIAAKTIPLLRNGMSILVEGGTTIREIAQKIPPGLKATVFTVSPQTALALSEHERLEVIAIGDHLARNGNIFTGAEVVNSLAGIHVDLAIIGANGLSPVEGLTDSDWEVVQVMKAVIRSAKHTAVVTISEKLGTVKRLRIGDPADIHWLITELAPSNRALAGYRRKGLSIL